MDEKVTCGFCGNEFPSHLTQCPHCAQPASHYPNVTAANDPEEKSTLELKYKAAMLAADRKSSVSVITDFESDVANNTSAVISGNFAEVNLIVGSDDNVYSTFYNLVHAGVSLTECNTMDNYRGVIEGIIFPGYKDKIRFAALTLDDYGVKNYATKKGGIFGSFE